MTHPITQAKDGIRIALQVQPRASRSEVLGLQGDALKVRVQAPPVEGAANQAVVELVAEALGVRRGAVSLVAGETGRRKVVAVAGITAAEAARRLRLEPPGGPG
ncbi:MAG: YggU family protein [Gemmatimonadetes bacterium]|nr:YggU family protein [Gemmatimonadota bacterium]